MADDLTAVAVAVVLRVFQTAAQLSGRQIIPSHGERSQPPILGRAGNAARGVVRLAVTSRAGQTGRAMIRAAARDVEEMGMAVVALAWKIRQRVAVLASGAGENAGNLLKSGYRFCGAIASLRSRRLRQCERKGPGRDNYRDQGCTDRAGSHGAPRAARWMALRIRA
jgi:hypothetical protein